MLLDVLRRLLIFCEAWFAAASCFGQAVSGSINGYITDSSSAVIATAKVVVVNEATEISVQLTTTNEGFYSATDLQPGLYSISAEQPGFSKLTHEHVRLDVDAVVRVDLTLSPGNLSQSVTVAVGSELLQSEKVDVSQTLGETQIRNLPVIGRNITNLYLTVPGALPDSFQMVSGEDPSGGVRTYINGTWSGSQEFVLDGITIVLTGSVAFSSLCRRKIRCRS